MLTRTSSRRSIQRATPLPPPGVQGRLERAPSAAGRTTPDDSSGGRSSPPLPTCRFGASPGLPPGATRPALRLGGIRGLAVPPELRRRVPGAVRAAPGAAVAAARIRLAVRKAQRKLLASQRKLQSSVDAVRSQLASRE